MEGGIRESDCRRTIRLLADAASLEGSHAERKRFLMRGLAELIGADAWVWTLGCEVEAGGRQTCVGFLHEGFEPEEFAGLLKALEDAEMGKIAAPFYERVAMSGAHTTMHRQEIDPEGKAYQGRVGDLWRAANIDGVIMSAYPLDARSLSGVAAYRRVGHPPFTERERDLLHIILSEVPWLHANGWPEDRGVEVPKLSPRERMVLNLLLDGKPRREIAESLEISEHTLGDYIKAVYRFFKVNSQGELIRRFMGEWVRIADAF